MRVIKLSAMVVFLGLFVIHLLIGSNLFMVVTFLAVSIVGCELVFKNRDLYFSDFFIFVSSLYCGFFPLIFKAILLQPLQSNLEAPVASTVCILFGFGSIYLAGKIVGRPRSSGASLANYFSDPDCVKKVMPYVTVLGILFYILHVVYRPNIENADLVQSEGFGGFGALYFLIIMSVCMQLYLFFVTKKKIYIYYLMVTLFVVVGLSIVGNVKKNIYDIIYVSVLGAYAFRLTFQKKFIVFVLFVLAVVWCYVSPVIHIMRVDFSNYTLNERLESFVRILSDNSFSPWKLKEEESRILESYKGAYSSQGSYIFPSTLNVDRFMLILPVDQVVRYYDYTEKDGFYQYIFMGIRQALPSVMVKKYNYVVADVVAWKYQIRDVNSIARPVIGLIASSIAAIGYIGAIVFPLLLLVPIFYLMNKFGGRLRGNWIALMLIGGSFQLSEKEIDALVIYIVREVPLNIVCTYFIFKIGELFVIKKNSYGAPKFL